MKKEIVILLILLNAFCNAQNRVNDVLPEISKISRGQLINATGWLKNNSGQWISRKNKIAIDLGQDQKALENYQSYSLGEDNFIYFDLKNIKIKDSTYIILIKKFRDGYYNYPAIQEDWNFRNSYAYYIFEQKELEKFKMIKSDTLNTIEIDLKATDIIRYVDLKTLTDNKIAKAIQENLNKNSFLNDESSFSNELPYTFPRLFIELTYFKSKNTVQFFISPKVYETENPHYYETDLITFSKFIKFK